jgi:hypothetical protein
MLREITIDPEDDDDDLDDQEIWMNICNMAAKRTDISVERAKAILGEGFHAFGHTGIVEAIEVVVAEVGRGKNPFEDYPLPPPSSKAWDF